jgi:hypothetical protein
MSFWDSAENEIESQREKYEETLEQINNKVDTNGNRREVQDKLSLCFPS